MLAAPACDEPPAPPHASPAPETAPPSEVPTAAPAPAPALTSLDEGTAVARAEEVLGQLAAKEFAQVRPAFDAAMAEAFPSDEALQRWWQSILAQTGAFQKVRRSQLTREGATTNVVLTSYFATQAWDVTVLLDAEGKVAGLSVLPSAATDLRPQTPKPPLPYATRDVTFEGDAGTPMGGSLSIPSGDGPHPAVVLISGSGSHDRDATVAGHRPFFLLADHLTRHGFAVLRYDDRGVGASKGDPTLDTVGSIAADAAHAVRFLARQPEVDRQRVGIVGHSVGGMVAPRVATAAGAAFVVTLAGVSVSGAELIPVQVGTLRRSEGRPAAVVDQIVAQQRILVDRIAADASAAAIDEATAALGQANGLLAETPSERIDAALTDALRKETSRPWYASFVKADPTADLAGLAAPILMLYAERDVLVPAELNEAAAKRALAKHPDATVQTLPGLNHLLQPAETGAMAEYVLIEVTLDPGALDLVTTWLRARAGLGEQ
jgi:pimeloyl-ACP methyl ester carboxylesterase